ALADVWHTGSVSGIKARGGFEIDMNWTGGDLKNVTVKSSIGGNLRLRTYVPLRGKGLKEAVGENPNPLLNPVEGTAAIISSQATLKGNILKKVFEYDVATLAGGKYTFTIAD